MREVMMGQKSKYVHPSGFYTTMESEPMGAELMVGGQRITEATRKELRARLRSGELDQLMFDAVVYVMGPNTNHTRFKPEDMLGFAQSFEGTPFLRNHDTRDIGARDGTVVASWLMGHQIHQTVRLTTERGMRDFLEGVIDRFSIGWYFEGVECGICGGDWMGCNHWPGQKYEGQVCELIFIGPRGKETSAVNAPAVQGTGVLDQLCQLKEMSSMEENAICVAGWLDKGGDPEGRSAGPCQWNA